LKPKQFFVPISRLIAAGLVKREIGYSLRMCYML
jgi:hypothetical protein